MNLSRTVYIILFFMLCGCKAYHEVVEYSKSIIYSGRYDKSIFDKHKTIAILPPVVLDTYNKEQKDIDEFQDRYEKTIHDIMIKQFQKRYDKGKFNPTIQNPEKTISILNLYKGTESEDVSYKELCKLLFVDAVVVTKWKFYHNSYNSATQVYAASEFIHLSTRVLGCDMEIFDTTQAARVWYKDVSFELGTNDNKTMDEMTKYFIKKSPY